MLTNCLPLLGGHAILGALVIPVRCRRIVRPRLHGARGDLHRLGKAFLEAFLLGDKLGVAPQQNVRAAACHVGGDRHPAKSSGLRHDLGFLLVMLGVQHDMLDALFLQQIGKPLGFFDGSGAHQYRLSRVVQTLHLVGGRKVLFLLGAVDGVGIFDPDQVPVRRDDDNFQFVNLVELGRFRLRRAGHAGQLLEHAKVILEGDGRQRLVFALDLHPFLRLDRLVQTIGPAPPRHQPSGELVDDQHLAVLHHVFHVSPVVIVCLERGLHVVLEVPILGIGDIAYPQHFFDFFPAIFGDGNRLVLFVDGVVAGVDSDSRLRPGQVFASRQLGNNPIHPVILVGRLLAGPADDQRRTRFVDQDRIHFVDNREAVCTLHAVAHVELHVVAQVVESKLVIRAVGDVGRIGRPPLFVIEVVNDYPDREPQEAVEFPHPLGVALGQVVVHRDHVHAAAGERIQIHRQGRHQCFALAGFHLGDLALVQHQPTDQLHVEVPHVEHPPARLADHGERLFQNLVQGFGQHAVASRLQFLGAVASAIFLFGGLNIAVGVLGVNRGHPLLDASAEFFRLGNQLRVTQLAYFRFERIHAHYPGLHALDFALVGSPKYLRHQLIDQTSIPL